MTYKCIKEMWLSKCDGDGFWTDEEGHVPISSEWYDETINILDGEVHLECISGCEDFTWIEISKEHFKENFVEVEEKQ